jgi:hypothetical protein
VFSVRNWAGPNRLHKQYKTYTKYIPHGKQMKVGIAFRLHFNYFTSNNMNNNNKIPNAPEGL